jgi:hypothetical protein
MRNLEFRAEIDAVGLLVFYEFGVAAGIRFD